MNRIRQGSLRDEGEASIAVSKPTRAMLRQLAGDMPVSEYVKALATKELGGKVSLPGQERGASKNTIPAIKSDTEQSLTLMRSMSEVLSGFFEPWVVFQSKDKQEASADAIEARLRQIADILNKSHPEIKQKGLFNESIPS